MANKRSTGVQDTCIPENVHEEPNKMTILQSSYEIIHKSAENQQCFKAFLNKSTMFPKINNLRKNSKTRLENNARLQGNSEDPA